MARKNTNKNALFDVIIAGGGPAGLAMAALLGSRGISALVIERENRAKLSSKVFDGRTTALAYGSKLVFEMCGVWPRLASHAGPIVDIKVIDQRAPQILNFLSRESGDHPFGYVVDNCLLRAALFDRVAELPAISLATERTIEAIDQHENCVSVNTDDGQHYTAALLIAADGRNSFCRRQTGIKTHKWDYNETALVATIAHEKPHANMAIENFYPGGPFAVLPMTNNRSGIVWTEKPANAETLLHLDEDSFIKLLVARGAAHLGAISLASPRMLYPLRFMLADELWKDRTVLIGEAAHGMHPIAGQGFNLSVRDSATLAMLLGAAKNAGSDLGAPDLLRDYAARRHPDHLTFMAATDALVKLFSNNFPPIRWVRQIGLGLVQHIPPAKRFFSRMATGIQNQNHS